MAKKKIEIQEANRGGTVLIYRTSSSATNPLNTTDEFVTPNDGTIRLFIKNGADACDVTVKTDVTVDGVQLGNKVVTVAANTDVYLGPYPIDIYSNELSVSFSDVDNVSYAVVA